MFSKKKNTSKIDYEQRELYENARRRAKQKKRLFQHFVFFLVGSVFLIILNVVIGFKEEFKPLGYNWFLWVVLLWALLFTIHLLNVFIISSFMGKEWEAKEVDKLVKKQKARIDQLQKKVEKDHPIPEIKADKLSEDDSKKKLDGPGNPDYPINS